MASWLTELSWLVCQVTNGVTLYASSPSNTHRGRLERPATHPAPTSNIHAQRHKETSLSLHTYTSTTSNLKQIKARFPFNHGCQLLRPSISILAGACVCCVTFSSNKRKQWQPWLAVCQRKALAFLVVFVYATQAIDAFEWKPGFTPATQSHW